MSGDVAFTGTLFARLNVATKYVLVVAIDHSITLIGKTLIREI
jgi:hypothetical protein